MLTKRRLQFGTGSFVGTYTPPTPAAPVFSTAPAIIGAPVVGVASSYSSGAYTGYPPPTITQQWTYGGVDIGGATAATYTPIAGQESGLLRVRQILTNGSGSANNTSASATINRIPDWTSDPAIVGTPTEGVSCTCTAGTYVGYPAPTITYQWALDGVSIPGATLAAYTPTLGDVGGSLRRVTTITNAYGFDSAITAPVTVVASGGGDTTTAQPPGMAELVGGVGQIVATWDEPLYLSDGTPWTEQPSYKVYYGPPGAPYSLTLSVSVAAGTLTRTITGLSPGQYTIEIASVNSYGEGPRSNILPDVTVT